MSEHNSEDRNVQVAHAATLEKTFVDVPGKVDTVASTGPVAATGGPTAEVKSRASVSPSSWIVSAASLMAMVIPPPRWVVHGLLSAGVTLVAGKPKSGKSWLALALAVAAARGTTVLGNWATEVGGVLYLALEDSDRRLQDRLRLTTDCDLPAELHFATQWPRLNEGGTNMLDEWLTEHPNTQLVIIDTLQKVRAPQKANVSVYAEDYAAVAGLKSLADKHGIAILLVHHVRKAPAADAIDEVSGSTGLTGVVDAIWVLRRDRGANTAKLHVTGRDVEEQILDLAWDSETASWSASGGTSDARRSPQREAILTALATLGAPMTPTAIAEALGKSANTVKRLMWQMGRDGELKSDGKGRYSLNNIDNPGN